MAFFKKAPKMRLAVLISGRGSNMHALLKKIQEKKLHAEICVVFSDKQLAGGLAIARSHGIPALSFSPKEFVSFQEYEIKLAGSLQNFAPDFIVCAGYMRILRKTMLTAFPQKILNIHPALLPSFPGLHAQKQAIEYGVKVSGCTVHFVDAGMDTGPIVLQTSVRVEGKDNEETLSAKILRAEHDTYWRALELLFRGYRIEGRKVIPGRN